MNIRTEGKRVVLDLRARNWDIAGRLSSHMRVHQLVGYKLKSVLIGAREGKGRRCMVTSRWIPLSRKDTTASHLLRVKAISEQCAAFEAMAQGRVKIPSIGSLPAGQAHRPTIENAYEESMQSH